MDDIVNVFYLYKKAVKIRLLRKSMNRVTPLEIETIILSEHYGTICIIS